MILFNADAAWVDYLKDQESIRDRALVEAPNDAWSHYTNQAARAYDAMLLEVQKICVDRFIHHFSQA